MIRRSKYGRVDPRNPEAAGRCDRGGEIRKRSELIPEMAWRGDVLRPNGFLVCRFHIDQPQDQDRAKILRCDPVPVDDPRVNIDAQPVPPAPPPGGDLVLTEGGGALLTEDGGHVLTEGGI
jgi:hypothetical protein